MKTVAIIPARGGSKGLPRKNVLPFAGKPLIAWNIQAALASSSVDTVVVSTDDAEIAAAARRFGAEVIDRPAALANDTASSESALLHALDSLEQKGQRFDVLVFLQCTSPLTTPEDIDGVTQLIIDEKADSAFAATAFHHFVWKRSRGTALGVNHKVVPRLRRQDREAEYLETGSVYAMKVDGFRQSGHRFFGNIGIHEVPRERSHEIDDREDFNFTEKLMLQNLQRKNTLPWTPQAVVFDFDGVMTDDRVLTFDDGKEAVFCSRSDGLGLERLRALPIKTVIISKEQNAVVRARAAKLKMPCHHGVEDKLSLLKSWAEMEQVELTRTIYVGNDVNDLAAMTACGLGAAPSDARPEVLDRCGLRLSAPGGRGAVRELCELILRSIEPASN